MYMQIPSWKLRKSFLWFESIYYLQYLLFYIEKSTKEQYWTVILLRILWPSTANSCYLEILWWTGFCFHKSKLCLQTVPRLKICFNKLLHFANARGFFGGSGHFFRILFSKTFDILVKRLEKRSKWLLEEDSSSLVPFGVNSFSLETKLKWCFMSMIL